MKHVMGTHGISRKIDQLGRVVIPADFRTALGVKADSMFGMVLNEGKIILTPLHLECIFCGGKQGLIEFKDFPVCDKCREELAE